MTDSANDSTGQNPQPRRRSTASGKSKATTGKAASSKKTAGKSASKAKASGRPNSTRSTTKKKTGTTKSGGARKATQRSGRKSMAEALAHVTDQPSRRQARSPGAGPPERRSTGPATRSSAASHSVASPLPNPRDHTVPAVGLETGPLETGPLETGGLETGGLETGGLETGAVENGATETVALASMATAVAELPTDAETETETAISESLDITIEAVEPAPAGAPEGALAREVEAIDKLAAETQAIMERLLAAVDEQDANPGSTTTSESMVDAFADATSDFEVELLEDEAVTIETDAEPTVEQPVEQTDVGAAPAEQPAAADAIPTFESSDTGSWLMDPAPADPTSAPDLEGRTADANTSAGETDAADATVTVDYAESTTAPAEATTVTVQTAASAGTLTVAAPVIATSAASPNPDDTLLFVKIVAPFLLGVGAGILIGLMG